MKVIRRLIKGTINSIFFKNIAFRDLIFNKLAEEGYMFFKKLEDYSIVYYPHDIIGRMIDSHGSYQRFPVDKIATIFEQIGILNKDFYIIELGANIGTHTIYFSRSFQNAKIIAVEADPENVDILDHNIRLNELQSRVQIVSAAVSNHNGEIDIVRNFYNRGGTSVDGDRLADKASVFSVPCLTVDEILNQKSINPEDIGLIWIDVEDHEYQVFQGMAELFSKAKPPVFFELSPRTNKNYHAILDLIFSHYSSIYICSGDKFLPASREDFSHISVKVDVYASV